MEVNPQAAGLYQRAGCLFILVILLTRKRKRDIVLVDKETNNNF